MKTLKTIAKFSFIAVSLFFLSCGDDDDTYYPPVTNTPTNASYVSGKVDGHDFSSIVFGTSTAQCTRVGAGDEQLITILGGDMAANSISIGLWNIHATGTYNFNQDSESFLSYSPGSGGVAYSTAAECETAHGTVTITYIDDTKVEGTFSFTGVNTEDCAGGTKTVTEGSFRGTYQQ